MDYAERRRRQSEQTETLILDAALRLMAGRGFDDVSIREICREAGITTGAFYHHFASKDVLLLRCFSSLKEHLESALTGQTGSPRELLRCLVAAYADYMSNEGALLAKYYEYRLGNPDVSASFDSDDFLRHTLQDYLKQAQTKGELSPNMDPAALAHYLHLHYRGIVIDWILHNYEYSLKDYMLEDFALIDSLLP